MEQSPDVLSDERRWWWCPECGAVYGRHHTERGRKFCWMCDSRHAVHIEMKPVGKNTHEITG